MFPERFNNKTNGVTPRRWLLLVESGALPRHHRGHRRRLDHRPQSTEQAQAAGRRQKLSSDAFLKAKRDAKWQFADWLKWSSGHRRSTPTRSSIARSNAFTNTSGNC